MCASLASGQFSTLVDTRFYLPEQWADDPKRCRKAQVPEAHIRYQSKAEIVLESAAHLREIGVRFDVVSMDSGYGSQPALLHGLDARGETFVAEVHSDQHLWAEQPWHHQEPKRLGAKPLKHPRESSPSVRVDAHIQAQSELEWQRLKVRSSDQGWVEVSYLARRIWVKQGEDEKPWWLLAWENPDEARSTDKHGRKHGPRRHYALSNAPADADARRLIADGVERNVVERNFRDAKSEIGMADYQTRGWVAWHHHMALVMLAMLFMLSEKVHNPPSLESLPEQVPEPPIDDVKGLPAEASAPPTKEAPIAAPASTEGNNPAPAKVPVVTANGPPARVPALTTGDIVFVMERLLPQRGYALADVAEVKLLLRARMLKRALDQRRRQAETAKNRPPLFADEHAPIK